MNRKGTISMKDGREIAQYSLKALGKTGLEKYECSLDYSRKHELNVDSDEISLLRTTDDVSLSLGGITEDREASLSINQTDRKSIDEAAEKVYRMAASSEADPANDISPVQEPASFHKGPAEPDRELMYARMKSFMEYSGKNYPSLILEQAILDFTLETEYYLNSNDVDLSSSTGSYSFFPMFTSKEGEDTSSFNYARMCAWDLDRQLWKYGSVDDLMEQSTGQVRPTEFQGKFIGDVIVTPDCLEVFLSYIGMYLQDYPMIKGTSIFRDSLEKQIAAPCLTLRSKPVSGGLPSGYFITGDGFTARDTTVIQDGVLKSYLLSLYGANKTGLKRSPVQWGPWIVDEGSRDLDEMIGSVEKGILLCRFSGGMPSESGDFSGVAKNSYLIEDGAISEPVKEVMISGNLKDFLLKTEAVSRERINSGYGIFPWLLTRGVSIFGK